MYSYVFMNTARYFTLEGQEGINTGKSKLTWCLGLSNCHNPSSSPRLGDNVDGALGCLNEPKGLLTFAP